VYVVWDADRDLENLHTSVADMLSYLLQLLSQRARHVYAR